MRRNRSIAANTLCFESPVNRPFRPRMSASLPTNRSIAFRTSAAYSSRVAPLNVTSTDVGFGVSQILPVITLCYYAPPGSILLLEQPEIHLHPSVQAGLADVFIDAIKTRGIQIILFISLPPPQAPFR